MRWQGNGTDNAIGKYRPFAGCRAGSGNRFEIDKLNIADIL
jgi:hypothetical protein